MNINKHMLKFAMQTPQTQNAPAQTSATAPASVPPLNTPLQNNVGLPHASSSIQFGGKQEDAFAEYFGNKSRQVGQRFKIEGLNLQDKLFASPAMIKALLGNQDTIDNKDPLMGLAIEQILIACENFIDLKHSGWFSGKKENQATLEMADALVAGLTHPYEEVSNYCEDFIKKVKPSLLKHQSVQEKIKLTQEKEQAAQTANQIFSMLGVNYKVNRSNVFSADTVKALLKATPESKQETESIYSMLNIIEPRLLNSELGRKAISFMHRDYKNLAERLEDEGQRYLKSHCLNMADKIETNQLKPVEKTDASGPNNFEINLSTNARINTLAAQMAEDIKIAAERNIDIKKYLDTELNGFIPDPAKIVDALRTEVRSELQEESPNEDFDDLEYASRILEKLYSNTLYLSYGYPPVPAVKPEVTNDNKLNLLLEKESTFKVALTEANRIYMNGLIALEIETARFERAKNDYAIEQMPASLLEALKEIQAAQTEAKEADNIFKATDKQRKLLIEFQDFKDKNDKNKTLLESAQTHFENFENQISKEIEKSLQIIGDIKEQLNRLQEGLDKHRMLQTSAKTKDSKLAEMEALLKDDELDALLSDIDQQFGEDAILAREERRHQDLAERVNQAIQTEIPDLEGLEDSTKDQESSKTEQD